MESSSRLERRMRCLRNRMSSPFTKMLTNRRTCPLSLAQRASCPVPPLEVVDPAPSRWRPGPSTEPAPACTCGAVSDLTCTMTSLPPCPRGRSRRVSPPVRRPEPRVELVEVGEFARRCGGLLHRVGTASSVIVSVSGETHHDRLVPGDPPLLDELLVTATVVPPAAREDALVRASSRMASTISPSVTASPQPPRFAHRLST